MNKEIERKYSVNYVPDQIQIQNIYHIEQAFVYKDMNTIIRIRKISSIYHKEEGIKFIYTIKTKGDIQYDKDSKVANKYEIESEIAEKDYKELINNKISQIITKDRMIIPIENDLKVEIDIYYDYLKGLLTAEVEFPTEEISKTFIKPKWLGEELGYSQLSNRKLAEMTQEEFNNIVSQEFLRNNEAIIQKIKQRKEYN